MGIAPRGALQGLLDRGAPDPREGCYSHTIISPVSFWNPTWGWPSPALSHLVSLCPALTGQVWPELSLQKRVLWAPETVHIPENLTESIVPSTCLMAGPQPQSSSPCFYGRIVGRNSSPAIWQNAALPLKPHYVKIGISSLLLITCPLSSHLSESIFCSFPRTSH